MSYHTSLAIVLTTLYVLHELHCCNGNGFHDNQQLNFTTEIVRNFHQCKSLCDRRPLCKSVNFDTKTRECRSNFYDVEDSGSNPHVVSATKQSSKQPGGECGGGICQDHQICISLGSAGICFDEARNPQQTQDVQGMLGYTGINQTQTNTTVAGFPEIHCGEPPPVPHAIVSKNGTSLNSLADYSCDDGYVIAEGNTTTSKCQATRKWTRTDFKCLEIDGGEQPPVPHPIVSKNGTSLNSLTDYSCDDGYVIAECQAIKWLPTCCWCIEIYCAITHIVPKDVVYPGDKTSLKSGVTYRCIEDDVDDVANGVAMTSTCDSTGNWSTVSLQCKNIDTYSAFKKWWWWTKERKQRKKERKKESK